jgi:hypothetical protein
MMATKTIITLSFLSLLIACSKPTSTPTAPVSEPDEASSADIGDHVVHFSAQLTDQLPPEVARTYNFVRSKNRAMLIVSVLDSATTETVVADVTVKTVNLTGQLKNVTMREIREQEAIYYIGETPVANRETLIFDISITPDGSLIPSDVRFKRQFYTD